MQWKERLHLTSDPLSSKPPGSCQQHCSARAAKLPRYALGPKKRSGFPFQRRPAANQSLQIIACPSVKGIILGPRWVCLKIGYTPKWPCGGDMILVQWIQGVPSFSDKPQCEKIPETVALLKHRNPKKVKRQQIIAQLGTCSRQSTSAATESEGPDDTSIKQSGHLGTFFTVHLSHLAWIELIS